jgi:hypothetical protein
LKQKSSPAGEKIGTGEQPFYNLSMVLKTEQAKKLARGDASAYVVR